MLSAHQLQAKGEEGMRCGVDPKAASQQNSQIGQRSATEPGGDSVCCPRRCSVLHAGADRYGLLSIFGSGITVGFLETFIMPSVGVALPPSGVSLGNPTPQQLACETWSPPKSCSVRWNCPHGFIFGFSFSSTSSRGKDKCWLLRWCVSCSPQDNQELCCLLLTNVSFQHQLTTIQFNSILTLSSQCRCPESVLTLGASHKEGP